MNDSVEKQIARALRGDESAAQGLVEILWGDLCTFARRMGASEADAEDVAQESVLKAISSLGSYTPGTSFRNWALKIAANCILDDKRKARARREVTSGEYVDAAASPRAALDGLELEELQEALDGAMQTLSDIDRAIFVMRVYRGLRYDEIAKIVEKPAPTVRWHLHRTRAKLIDQLKPYLCPAPPHRQEA